MRVMPFTVTPLTNDTDIDSSQLESVDHRDIMTSPRQQHALALNKAWKLFKQAGLQKGQIC